MRMRCPYCEGRGEVLYYAETARDETTVTVKPKYDICRKCNGSGEKTMTNADRIQEKLAETLSGMCKIAEQCDFCPLEGNCPGGSYDLHVWSKWLQQHCEED